MPNTFSNFVEDAPPFPVGSSGAAVFTLETDGKIPVVEGGVTHFVLGSAFVAGMDTGIAAEAAARHAADAALQENINSEAADRAEADAVLHEADAVLQTNIEAEATVRASADIALQISLDEEAATREAADTRLQANIDAEASTRSSMDAALQGDLDNEMADRTEADIALQTNIDAEATARTEADALLLPRLGVTDGTEALPGHIGEYKVTSNVVGVQMAADIPTQICPLSLTPGDWDIWGSVDYMPPSNVSPNMIAASVSVHPDQLPNEDDLLTGVGILNMFTTTALTSGQRQVLMTGQCRSNSDMPLDLYLVAQISFTSAAATVLAKGYLCARRVR